ncbi:sulfotransferase domain-containing protein [Methyloglobulus sp.]|uniref:sulfotransferase domain-containing protein n=1 Tax=Methyloglobulus sp. TaxID=2518622 RepID=UPI0032B83E1D
MARLPDFIIIGAAKCGTTTLYKKLANHPRVFMSTPKEPEFFARDDIYEKGLDWYANLFASATDSQLCGEASTLYTLTTLFPHTVSRMHNTVPQAKLIYVLREPVNRAYSFYTQLVKNYQNCTRNFNVNRTFDECLFPDLYPNRCSRVQFFAPFDKHLPDDPRTLLDGSRYMTQINNYLCAFDRSQLLLLDFKELVENPDKVMVDVCEFLNLDISEMRTTEEVRENISSEHFQYADAEITRQGLVSKVKSNPIGRKLIQMTPMAIKKRLLDCYTLLFKKTNDLSRPAKMSPRAEGYLHEIFKDEIIGLEDFWKRDLSSWQQKNRN